MELLASALLGAKIVFLIAVCYCAGAGFVARRPEDNSPGVAIVAFAAGLGLMAFAFLLSKFTGTVIALFVFLPGVIAAAYWLRRPRLGIGLNGRAGEVASALALCIVSGLPTLIMGMRMGAGPFPAEVFAVDSPFFLQQVYALMRTGVYPPPSLELLGHAFNYHYGIQAFTALTSLALDLKPHLVLFGILEPLLEILAAFVVYDIARLLTGRHRTALLCLLVVLLGSKQYLINYLDPSWWRILTREEYFNFRYPNAPDVAGMLVSLCAVRCMLEFERRHMRLAGLFLMCLLPVFKIPFMVPICAGIALIYLIELRKQFRSALLAEIAGGAVVCLLCYLAFARSDFTSGGAARAQFLGFLGMSMPWDKTTLMIYAALVVLTAVATRQALSAGLSRLLLLAIAPHLVFFMWLLQIDNVYQIFTLATRLVVLFAAIYVLSAWLDGARRFAYRHVLVGALLVALTGPGLVSLANHIDVVLERPQQGHEYADNRAVANALLHIPLDGTLLVTNDLRYPANRYLRDNRQLQLAGVFGHPNLASNLEYGGVRKEDTLRYARLVKLFRAPNWPAGEIGILQKNVGITHLLIHKSYPHATDIPLTRVYENDEYAVYQF
jgi:hypothetical protein